MSRHKRKRRSRSCKKKSWVDYIAEGVTRLVYFFMGAVNALFWLWPVPYMFGLGIVVTALTLAIFPDRLWYVIGVAGLQGLIVALVGPSLYERNAKSDRGRLQEIRDMSKIKPRMDLTKLERRLLRDRLLSLKGQHPKLESSHSST